MALFGLRNKVKALIKDALQLNDEEVEQQTQMEPPVEPTYHPPKEEEQEEAKEPEVEEAPVEESAAKEDTSITAAAPVTGRDLTPENVQEVLDDEVVVVLGARAVVLLVV